MVDTYLGKKSSFRVEADRQALLESESPIYSISNSGTISTNAEFTFDLEAMPYGKYLPYNFVSIQNNSAQRIRLIINDTLRLIIPAGVIKSIDSSTIPAIWNIKVINLGSSAIGLEEIDIDFQKVKNVEVKAVKLFAGGL